MSDYDAPDYEDEVDLPERVDVDEEDYLDEDDDSTFCPRCDAPMYFRQDMEIDNDLLYSASGGYDGYHFDVWYECPGCGYSDK